MNTPSFHNPVAISFLEPYGWEERLRSLVDEKEPVLFLYSKSAFASVDGDGTLLRWLGTQRHVTVLTGIMSNPSFTYLADVRKKLGPIPSTVVAMGGGSTIDVAKILIALQAYPCDLESGDLLSIVEEKQYVAAKDASHLIAVPTTAGTGSELTKWATIWDMVHKRKYSVEREDLYPAQAWVDPGLTVGLPEQITRSTGLDALSHAVEAYWSVKSNPIVRRLASQAIVQIRQFLERAIDNPKDMEAREGMCMGSVFAGLAFSQTRTTACHALSYPLTARYDIPHGMAVALWLAPVMKLNWDAIREKQLFTSAFRCSSREEIEQWLHTLVDSSLWKEYGITQASLREIYSDNDFMKDRLGNNPVAIDLDAILPLIESGSF